MKKTATTDTVPGNCWSCGMEFRKASDIVGGSVPKKGSVSVCIGCAAIGIFNEDLSVRKPNPEELVEITTTPGLADHILAVATILGSVRRE